MSVRDLISKTMIIVLVILISGCGVGAPKKKAQLDCMNQLKQIGLALVFHATENDNVLPEDFSAIASRSFLNMEPSVMVCPSDQNRQGLDAIRWEDFELTKTSYALVTPSARFEPGGTNDLVRCPIHRQLAYREGNGVRGRPEHSNP